MASAAQTAYWWLSWDSAFPNGSPLSEPVFRSKFFARRDLLHLAQTFRTHSLLRDRGAAHILDLVSYTEPTFYNCHANQTERYLWRCLQPTKIERIAQAVL